MSISYLDFQISGTLNFYIPENESFPLLSIPKGDNQVVYPFIIDSLHCS